MCLYACAVVCCRCVPQNKCTVAVCVGWLERVIGGVSEAQAGAGNRVVIENVVTDSPDMVKLLGESVTTAMQ